MGRQGNLILLLMSLSSMLVCGLGRHVVQDESEETSGMASEYVIIFDAGSTKTKLEIYKIDVASPPLDVADVHELDPSPSEKKPGIADLDPSEVESYLQPLLDSAIKTIPAEKHSSTHLFFLATGGMRLLDEDKSEAILDQVKELLNDKAKCPFMFDSKDAQVISGAFEGIYAWMSVNFLEGNFIPGKSHHTYGILDLGGASHQNAVQFGRKREDLYLINVGGKEFKLFARSYLGYGLNEARKTYLERLSKKPLKNGVIRSPCHHKGFNEKIDINGELFTVVGTAHVPICRRFIEKTFFCKRSDCPFSDQPKLRGDYFGFAGIYYAATTIGILCSDCAKPLSPVMFDEGSREFCAKSFESINSNPYAKDHCFGGNFVFELLTQGYWLSAHKTIMVGNTLEGFSLGWTLGAALFNSELL
ncbi:ectonucleoside triphosphate diphosphohydrolase 1-like [Stylophora pistillata]|uniref:ectonucleoside triphosphate diphosphohydrolase 1-like n=1 Tax=Stylophora pistillata TaxID=50429 RepID=UPI000C038FB4|nr:ectonucleoside triphosphate diphosphohydrolase 1-like [Stylophora pistillata]